MRAGKFIDYCILCSLLLGGSGSAMANDKHSERNDDHKDSHTIQLGPRPHFLVNDMDPGALKKKLEN